MEVLHTLEERMKQLVEAIKKLRIEKDALIQENQQLYKRIEELELSVLHGNERMEKEKVLTKEVVDELIKNIDSLVGTMSDEEVL